MKSYICFSFFRYSIGLWRVQGFQGFLGIWLRNQNEGDCLKAFIATSSNEYRTTVWTPENIFYHMFIAMTLNAFLWWLKLV